MHDFREVIMRQSPFLAGLLDSVIERSRMIGARAARLAPRGPQARGADPVASLRDDARALLSGRGEASGMATAARLLARFAALDEAGRLAFFTCLANDFDPDRDALRVAWRTYEDTDTPDAFRALTRAIEPPRQELFRRLNRAPGGTAALVTMRAQLLAAMAKAPGLACVDDDLVHLLQSWFNRGFLVMRRIDWSTSADLLERIIRYEAVHKIGDWDELRRRLLPSDRRCYAFFHPALVDEPLIFVEVALTRAIPSSIQHLLAQDRTEVPGHRATTAVFYSISNCQPGLKGVSFGNFLIKQVVEELSRELPGLKTFVTLSPVPRFRRWLAAAARDPAAHGLGGVDLRDLAALDAPEWDQHEAAVQVLQPLILSLAHHYFLTAKAADGQPFDPVARFHLGNGARLEHIHWMGDNSPNGLSQSAGIMVNYLYDLRSVEPNHEGYANQRKLVTSDAINRAARAFSAQKDAVSTYVQ